MRIDEDPYREADLVLARERVRPALLKIIANLLVHGVAADARITLAAKLDPRFVARALEDDIRFDERPKLAAAGVQHQGGVRAVRVGPDERRLRLRLVAHHASNPILWKVLPVPVWSIVG